MRLDPIKMRNQKTAVSDETKKHRQYVGVVNQDEEWNFEVETVFNTCNMTSLGCKSLT